MNFGALDGDRIVQLLGPVMVMALLAHNSTLRGLPARQKVAYAVVWAGVFIIGAVIVGSFAR